MPERTRGSGIATARARLRRALCETRDRHPAASTTQSARASRRAPPARRGSPSRSGGDARSFASRPHRSRHRETRRAVPCYRTYAYRLTGSGPRSFSKRALDAGFGQLLPEHGQSLIQTGLYRTQRAIQEISNFLERQPGVLLEDDGGPLLLRQLRHGLTHGTPYLVPGDEILDAFRGARFPCQLDDVDPFGRLDDGRPALATDPVAAEIQRNSIQP